MQSLTHAVHHALPGGHADGTLIGACNPMYVQFTSLGSTPSPACGATVHRPLSVRRLVDLRTPLLLGLGEGEGVGCRHRCPRRMICRRATVIETVSTCAMEACRPSVLLGRSLNLFSALDSAPRARSRQTRPPSRTSTPHCSAGCCSLPNASPAAAVAIRCPARRARPATCGGCARSLAPSTGPRTWCVQILLCFLLF